MKDITSIIKLIGQTSSYNDKLALLKKYSGTPGLKEVLRFIYNPYNKTGIASTKLSKAGGLMNQDAIREIEWREALDYFSHHQTGSDADLVFARAFITYTNKAYGPDAMRLACAIVTQDLKIGITATSLNKVYGASFIPKTGCMLGTLFGDVPAHKVTWPCIVTEKLDGIRRVLVKDNGVIHMYSRSGHLDEGLIEILEEAKHLPDNYVYDGELLAKGVFKDSIALRQATASLANSKGAKTGLTFNVFDMIPVDEFYAGKSTETAFVRKIRLGATLMDESISIIDEEWNQRIAAFGIYEELDSIKPVPILGYAKNMDQVEPIVEEIWAHGGEGVMLNTFDGLYEIKRTRALLKIKHTEEHILPVVNVVEGTGKYEDSLGALVCEYVDKRGVKSYLGVGSGFTDEQRHRIWRNPDKYIGLKVEVETFGESTNASGYTSLNCPIFKRFVGEE